MTPCTFFYSEESGRIAQHIEPPLHGDDVGGEYSVLHTEGDASMIETHYVEDGVVVPRPSMPITGGGPVAVGETWRIDGIPTGAVVKYPGGSIEVDDGFIEWSAAESGEYAFTITCFPYLELHISASITSV